MCRQGHPLLALPPLVGSGVTHGTKARYEFLFCSNGTGQRHGNEDTKVMEMWLFKELRIHYLEEHFACGERHF